MNKQVGALVAAGGLLIAAKAAAQNAPAASYSANAAIASPTVSPPARQAMQAKIDAVNAKFRASHGGQSPELFGLQCCQVTQFHALGFAPAEGFFTVAIPITGYIYQPLASAFVTADVLLPSGVEIEYLDLYYDDPSTLFDIHALLIGYSGGTQFTGPPASSLVGDVASSGSAGYGFASQSLSYTVNNNVEFDTNAASLVIRVSAQSTDLGFKGVDLWWMRQISPAPNTATFTDVLPGHPFFQFVEALAAAGITVGYPDGRFGVDDPITRGQMAVFLAKALGLYWPL